MFGSFTKTLMLTLLGSGLAGCSTGETTHTANWYMKHNQARDAKIKQCANNPGQLRNTSNCENAKAATRKLSAGSLPHF
jgi:hypothetical protein